MLGASVRWGSVLFSVVAAAVSAAPVTHAQDDAPLKFTCVVRDAQILPDRTQVRCANKGMNGLSEFAAETNQPYAGRVANAIVHSLRTGTNLILTYAPSTELNPDGCSVRTCRKIIDVGGTGRVPPRPAPAALPQTPIPETPPANFDEPDAFTDEPDTVDALVQLPPSPAPAAPPLPVTRPMQPIAD